MELAAHNLCKTWNDGRLALKDFTGCFAPGTITALVGRNGSGKTTALRLLAGLLRPDSGSVTRPPGRMGFLFQQGALWPHLNVRQQLELPLRLVLGLKNPAPRTDELMKKFGIDGYSTQYPPELSGGQQQRVAIARCLSVEPVAVFLDEITNALDPAARHEITTLVDDLRRQGLIVITSTHDLAWVSKSADHAIYLRDGRIVRQGLPKEVMTATDDPMFA